MRALVLGVATLALSAGAASAQAVYPSGYGYDATPVVDLAAPAYGYAAPAYGYAAPAAPTVVIVTPAPAYAAALVVSGYATQPIYAWLWIRLHTRILEPRLLGPLACRVWVALKKHLCQRLECFCGPNPGPHSFALADVLESQANCAVAG